MKDSKKMALLIDGDNAESNFIEQVISEAGKFGRVTIKRIYADWTSTKMSSWKAVLNKHAIRPMQKFSYTVGKNSTDTALIIDAMDIVHDGLVEGFCIFSSDSDYTGLAHRIREQGLYIMGIGRSHTPEAFKAACEHFTYVEILSTKDEDFTALPEKISKVEAKKREEFKAKTPQLQGLKVVGKINLNPIAPLNKVVAPINQQLIARAFDMAVAENTGLALLSKFSESLKKVDSTFDHRSYGCLNFREFCDKLAPYYCIYKHADGQTFSLMKKDKPTENCVDK
jgi:uncharacterized LabA/DUF88 family protein